MAIDEQTVETVRGVFVQMHLGLQLLIIMGATLGVHGIVHIIRGAIESHVIARFGSIAKARTIGTLFNSTLVFIIYFVGLGTTLTVLGVDIKAFVAGASIIGLAVAFGSQGFVQDVVTGMTVIFSDLFDVGELVEISGKSGIVKSVGMRFTVLATAHGAEVFIPNRTIGSVINYPKGYSSLMVDFRASEDVALRPVAVERAEKLMQGAYDQFSGIFLGAPVLTGPFGSPLGAPYYRIEFRIWPGKGTPIEKTFRDELAKNLCALDEAYEAWMIAVNYEISQRTVPLTRRVKREKAVPKETD